MMKLRVVEPKRMVPVCKHVFLQHVNSWQFLTKTFKLDFMGHEIIALEFYPIHPQHKLPCPNYSARCFKVRGGQALYVVDEFFLGDESPLKEPTHEVTSTYH